MKPGDDSAVPLCRTHHRELHSSGQKTFESKYRIDLSVLAARLWRESSMTRDEEGVFPDMAAEHYHAETFWRSPSLSASVGKRLVAGRWFSESPLHARAAHPKLNPDFEPKEKNEFDIGRAMHELVLKRGAGLVVIEGQDYARNEPNGLTKGEKTAMRDAAYAAGKTPILRPVYERCEKAAKYADLSLEGCEFGHPFRDGRPEVALRWVEKTRWGDVWCKALVDYLPNRRPIERGVDYKSTGQSANPAIWDRRQMANLGYDISAAFHRRGYRKLGLAHSCDYYWVIQEWNPPFACSLVYYADEELSAADGDIQDMIDQWARGVHLGEWPGYPMFGHVASRPKYAAGSKARERIFEGEHLDSETIARGL